MSTSGDIMIHLGGSDSYIEDFGVFGDTLRTS